MNFFSSVMACSIPSASLDCFTRYRGRIHLSPHMHTHTHTCMHTILHICTHTYRHIHGIHIYTHIHTCTHIHPHIHAHTLQTLASCTCIQLAVQGIYLLLIDNGDNLSLDILAEHRAGHQTSFLQHTRQEKIRTKAAY